MLRETFEELTQVLNRACQAYYGDRLVSVAVFGSVGRGTPRPDSDIDLILVIRDLPPGRPDRSAEFRDVERAVADSFIRARQAGVHAEISPVFKTPDEVRAGSPLFLDMTEDARILYDREDFFKNALDAFRERLKRLGARRIWKGTAWIWDLKPDYKPGEIFEL